MMGNGERVAEHMSNRSVKAGFGQRRRVNRSATERKSIDLSRPVGGRSQGRVTTIIAHFETGETIEDGKSGRKSITLRRTC